MVYLLAPKTLMKMPSEKLKVSRPSNRGLRRDNRLVLESRKTICVATIRGLENFDERN